MTNKKKIDIVAMQDELIRTFGWTVAAVFPDEDADEPGFTYTIGLAEKGLPELIVFALPPGAAQAILNDIAGQMVKGRKFPLDTPLDEILRGSKAMLVEADRLQTDGYMYGARRRFEGYRAWQLLWPDKAGKLPMDPGYDEERFGRLQPVLIPTKPKKDLH